MNEKDLAQKGLEDYTDVFADVVNALLYQGRILVREETLQPAPTETLYRDNRGKLRNQFQDVSKYVLEEDEIKVQYMMENQTRREPRMTLRKAGYEGAIYRQQLDKKETFPVVGIVLHWGRGCWRHPKSLRQLCEKKKLPEETKQYIDDIRLHVFNMRYLPPEVRSRFHSDMRIVVDYLAEGKDYQPTNQKIRHLEALVHMLTALTGDTRYELMLPQLKEEEEREGGISMCPLLDKYINQGIAQGISQGIAQGISQGIEQGISQGIELEKVRGKKDIILDFLSDIGEVFDDLRLRIMQEENLEKLTSWVKLAARAESIEDFCTRTGI